MSYKYTPEEIAGHRAAWYGFLRKHPERQGVGVLHWIFSSGSEFLCCLGAGCHVIAARGVRMRVEILAERVKYDGQAKIPPAAFIEAMELPHGNPMIEIGGNFSSAAEWNDDRVPWPKIADALEAAFPADPEAIRQAREAA